MFSVSISRENGTSVAWVRAASIQNGTRIPATDNLQFFNTPRDSTGYYNYLVVAVSNWNEVLEEGVKLEFFEDASLTTKKEVNAFGNRTYQGTVNRRVSPLAPKAVLEHKDGDWITLFTCEDYGEHWVDYGYRRIVQAVLVDVSPTN